MAKKKHGARKPMKTKTPPKGQGRPATAGFARPTYMEVKNRAEMALFLETQAICGFQDLGRNQTRVFLRSGHTEEIMAPYEQFKAFMTGNLTAKKPEGDGATEAEETEPADPRHALNEATG